MVDQSRKIEAALLHVAGEAVRRFELRAFQALTSGTPVDTGFARSGWTPSVGSRVLDETDRPAQDLQTVRAAQARESRNRAEAIGIAARYLISMGPVFLTNSVPYMRHLNMGSSSQAPAMFVEKAIVTAFNSLADLQGYINTLQI